MSGEYEAYERLIAPIEDKMMRAVWSVTQNPDDAEEALQEALSIVWRRFDRIQRHANPQALILRICLNAAYDLLRAKIRRRRREARYEPEQARPVGPDVQTGREEWRTAVFEAIGQLSRNQATAVMLRLVQGMGYDEIAQVLGCRASTARKHVERGRQRLRELLAPLVADDGPEVAI